MDSQTINFVTWNVNGLKQKREQKFQKLQNADIVFLQETHIGAGDEHLIEHMKNEWHIYYTKYTSQKGTAILVRKKIDFEIISDERDNCGIYVVLKCKLAGQLYTLVSVYNHEKDTKTLEKLSRYLQSMTTGLLVIGGDFNTVLNPFIDKNCNKTKMVKNRNHKKLLFIVEKFMTSLQLVDVWRRKNPVKQDFTFYIKRFPVSRLDYIFVPEECMWRVRSCEIRNLERPDHQPVSLEINYVSAMHFQKDPQVQSVPQWLNLKKDLLTEEMGSSLDAESSHAVSEVDIVSAVQSLQVSDTPRPDGIPVSFYNDNIQDLIPYIKILYNRIHRGAFNCSEKHFNQTVKSLCDNSQHFFNVDYLIIATILAKHLNDFLECHSKCDVLKDSATVMITPKTFHTEIRLSCIQDEIEKQKLLNPALYQVFLIVKNLLRDAPLVDTESVSTERDKLLDQGCPLTPVLITLALKCFASALVGHLKHDIVVFKESVIVCLQPEDLEEIITVVKNRASEVYDITGLSRGNILNNKEERSENNRSHTCTFKGEIENLVFGGERHNFIPTTYKEGNIIIEGDGRLTMYAVVTLQDSDEVMVVASNWLSPDKKQCHWPPFRSAEKFMEAVQNKFKPETGGKPWEKLNISFHEEHGLFDKAKERQKEIQERKERSFLFATEFPGLLKRQKLESTQQMAKSTLPTSSMSADAQSISKTDKDELFQMLKDIKRTVQENSAMLKKLVKDNPVSEVPSSSSVKTSLKLPLKSFEDVSRIERELHNQTARQKYVKILSKLGGFGPNNVIKNIMQHVMTDELTKKFNWQGRGDKMAFSKLILTDVIRDAASKQNVLKVECEKELKTYLWSKHDRIGRKRDFGVTMSETSADSSPSMLDSSAQSEIGISFIDEFCRELH